MMMMMIDDVIINRIQVQPTIA